MYTHDAIDYLLVSLIMDQMTLQSVAKVICLFAKFTFVDKARA
jgi:hypothetical protein